MSKNTETNNWRAGCDESCTSGSVEGFKKSTTRERPISPTLEEDPLNPIQHLDTKLNLNEYLVKHPGATFMMRAKNDAMIGSGIHPGDILIVDRSLMPCHNKVVIVENEGELIVRRLLSKGTQRKLLADNTAYESIDVKDDLVIWGVVTNVIHKL